MHCTSEMCVCVDRFSLNGDLMFTASSDGEIFVMDGRPSKNFAMLGFICKLFHNLISLVIVTQRRSVVKSVGCF